ncbi:uncharacterized protein MONBRDRAFT_38744 [Monosiga brevicollis MX1]|uniref:MORN repeat-containing protein 5 n=1 Tax=Monosiga brevicollis TaxID=81824 RepID=A9V9V1_MONBE|nr:uncharacterized protein MONBRDRAFT_38744 [Monosiga brevicollis MX1]EDQ85730.1 predicted protein [Monosiga brevicollis MX1]|eukprot:XP_001749445.1 hypothetical protein [Monosiga brevicollis MX1]
MAPKSKSGGGDAKKKNGKATTVPEDEARPASAGYFFRGQCTAQGQREGPGKEKLTSGAVYVGSFLNGLRHGQGTLVIREGVVYKGAFASGVFHGPGTLTSPTITLTGEWQAGQMQGPGQATYADGGAYVGDFLANKRHGQGQQTEADGSVYTGAWLDDCRAGHGHQRWAWGLTYEAQHVEWSHKVRNGSLSKPFLFVEAHSHGQQRICRADDHDSPFPWPRVLDIPRPLAARQVTHMALGLAHVAVILDPGTLLTAGLNHMGQLGLDDTLDRHTLVLVPSLEGLGVIAVACGAWHTVTLSNDHDVYAAGRNHRAQLGRAPNDSTRSTTMALCSQLDHLPPATVVAIAAGSSHTIALTAEHTAICWGDDSFGQCSGVVHEPLSDLSETTPSTKLHVHENVDAIAAGPDAWCTYLRSFSDSE